MSTRSLRRGYTGRGPRTENACGRALRRAEVAKAGKRSRGRTVSPDEQATAAAIAKAVKRVKVLAGTEVTLKAGAKGRGARLVVAVDVSLFARLVRAVAKLVGVDG